MGWGVWFATAEVMGMDFGEIFIFRTRYALHVFCDNSVHR